MQLDVTKEEALAIVQVLGHLPIQSNASGLWQKLQAQVQAQDAPAPQPIQGETV